MALGWHLHFCRGGTNWLRWLAHRRVSPSALTAGQGTYVRTTNITVMAVALFLFDVCVRSASGQTQQASATPTAGASTENLQKQTQNPVASLISVPFQNSTDFNIGSFARDRDTLNIQPVYPSQISKSWNLITRIITPVVFAPDINHEHLGTFGLGDIQPTFFFAPTKMSKLIWCAGPA